MPKQKLLFCIIAFILLGFFNKPSFAVGSYYKYYKNPVLDVSDSEWDSDNLNSPYVLYDPLLKEYKMYYAGSNNGVYYIGLAHFARWFIMEKRSK